MPDTRSSQEDTVISMEGGMGSRLNQLEPSVKADARSNDGDAKARQTGRQKRKYRCRVRSPGTIEKAKRQRRDKANARERRRMNSLNDALESLRQILPQTTGEDPKMTKIETLRTAQQYISFLSYAVSSPSGEVRLTDFLPSLPISSPDIEDERMSTFNESSQNQPIQYSTHYTPDPSPAYPSYNAYESTTVTFSN